MAKRFTDSEKWKKPFLRGMKAPYKLLWLYILDECDHAGIWQVDFEVAEIKIGEKLKIELALEQLKCKVHPFDDGNKWFIPDFIEFQYITLNPENRAHKSVIDLLTKYSLLDILKEGIKPLATPLQGRKDMDKEKDKDKDKDKDEVEKLKNDFEVFRQEYHGTKRGLDTEFETLQKHKDWKLIVPKLLPAIRKQKQIRESLTLAEKFVPEWKNLSTWLNQSCWEEEIAVQKSKDPWHNPS